MQEALAEWGGISVRYSEHRGREYWPVLRLRNALGASWEEMFRGWGVGAIAKANEPDYRCFMQVEKLKYVIWAKEMDRAVGFYCEVFDAKIVRRSDVMAEVAIAGSLLCIHGGGKGKRTWTGLSFQVGDLFAACDVLRVAGGLVLREPEDTPEEPAHLAMCADPEGNEIMLTLQRRN